MAGKRMSYFEEERSKNNANFYERMDDRQLRKLVRRIVKDIYNGLIKEQDYVYFMNDRIMSACLYVASTEAMKHFVIADSLQDYVNNPSKQDPMCKATAANTYNESAAKWGTWNICLTMFKAIAYENVPCNIAFGYLVNVGDINNINNI